jgi:hypothetical protein
MSRAAGTRPDDCQYTVRVPGRHDPGYHDADVFVDVMSRASRSCIMSSAMMDLVNHVAGFEERPAPL